MAKLSSISIVNFMSIKNDTVTFDDSNIINLCGYNDTGKSAIIRALEVLTEDAYSTEQVKYIHDDADHFIVGLEGTDGVALLKYKYRTGASRWVMSRTEVVDGKEVTKILFDNMLSNGSFARVDGVPEPFTQYLGMFKEDSTGESLNIRRCTDKLLLVDTTGGDNYKIINGYLQGKKVSWASKKAQECVNETQRNLVSKGLRLDELKHSLEVSVPIPEELEGKLSIGAGHMRDLEKRVHTLESILETRERLRAISVPPEVNVISLSKMDILSKLYDSLMIQRKPLPPVIKCVDVNKYKLLCTLRDALNRVAVSVPPEIKIIDLSRYKALEALWSQRKRVRNAEGTLEQLTAEYTPLRAELNKTAKENGWKICSNCGTVVDINE